MRNKFDRPVWYQSIPSGWRVLRVKDVLLSIDSGVWGEDVYDDDEGSPVLRSNEIDESGHWRKTVPARRLLTDSERVKTRLHEEDLLLVKSSGSPSHIGKTAVVTKSIADSGCCFSNFTARLKGASQHLCSSFMWYYLNNSPGRDQLFYNGTTTTGLINLSAKTIGLSQIVLPPVREQRCIAAHLDASCAAIDAAVAAKRGQIETLDALRASTLQRVITQGLTPDGPTRDTGNPWLERVPAGWSLVQLKRIAAVHGGLTLGKSYEGEALVEYPYLRVANVQDGHVDLTDVSTLEVPPAVAAGVMLRAGDVLMTEGGDLDKLGRGTVWEGQIAPCLHQNHVFVVRCIEHKLLPHFLAYVTASRYGRDYFEATGKRTTNLAATNATKVGAFYIPLPSLAEQKALVAYLDAEIGRLKAIQQVIGKQIDTLTAYRKSLIHECVTGQRRIGEAELAAAGVAP